MNTLPAWRRHVLFASLLILGFMYIAAFLYFRSESRNFLDVLAAREARLQLIRRPISPLPQRLVFSRGSAATAYLAAGWWPPGADGVTLVRSPAQLLLPLPRQRYLQLEFVLDAFVPVPARTTASLHLGERELARWPVGETPRLAGTRIVLTPADTAVGLVDLEFRLEEKRRRGSAGKPGVDMWLLLRELTVSEVAASTP
jgi:hypothetical protein